MIDHPLIVSSAFKFRILGFIKTTFFRYNSSCRLFSACVWRLSISGNVSSFELSDIQTELRVWLLDCNENWVIP